MAAFQAPIFNDEEEARAALEAIRWPDGPACPHCGTVGDKIAKVEGKKQSHRPGLYYCNNCTGTFTVTVGTVFERSKVPLTKWWLAAHLLNSSKRGVSAHKIHRTLGVSYKTAWFMMHRLREAMRELSPTGSLGGEGKTVEIDETYTGGKDKNRHKNKRQGRGGMDKEIAFALVERSGKVRSHHVPSVSAITLRPILKGQIDAATMVMSDDGGARLGREFAKSATVNHSIGEFVRGDAHTNTIEGYFSILKRGIDGVYHHVSAQHLKRYLAEFDFRYNTRMSLGVTDGERAALAMKGIEGKRLTYRPTH
jgi:transposase-like protein